MCPAKQRRFSSVQRWSVEHSTHPRRAASFPSVFLRHRSVLNKFFGLVFCPYISRSTQAGRGECGENAWVTAFPSPGRLRTTSSLKPFTGCPLPTSGQAESWVSAAGRKLLHQSPLLRSYSSQAGLLYFSNKNTILLLLPTARYQPSAW